MQILKFLVVLAFGVKQSSLANNVFTTVNLMVVLFVVIGGSFEADVSNWKISSAEVKPCRIFLQKPSISVGKILAFYRSFF